MWNTYFRQIICTFWIVCQQEPRGNSKYERRQSLKDKDPSPTTLTGNTIHKSNTIGEKPAASPGKCSTHEQVANSHRYLTLGVEKRQIYSSAGKETPFNGAKKQAARNQASIGFAYACKSTQYQDTYLPLAKEALTLL